MHLVRDVLDKKLFDREDCEIGRVDGLVMQLTEGSQPRITHIQIGGTTLWMRVNPILGSLVTKLAGMWGPRHKGPVRIPWSRVKTVGKDIKLDVKGKKTGALDWEIWIARHIIERIPGGGSEEQE